MRRSLAHGIHNGLVQRHHPDPDPDSHRPVGADVGVVSFSRLRVRLVQVKHDRQTGYQEEHGNDNRTLGIAPEMPIRPHKRENKREQENRPLPPVVRFTCPILPLDISGVHFIDLVRPEGCGALQEAQPQHFLSTQPDHARHGLIRRCRFLSLHRGLLELALLSQRFRLAYELAVTCLRLASLRTQILLVFPADFLDFSRAGRTVLLTVQVADQPMNGVRLVLIDHRLEVRPDVDHGVAGIADQHEHDAGHDQRYQGFVSIDGDKQDRHTDQDTESQPERSHAENQGHTRHHARIDYQDGRKGDGHGED